MILVDTSIWIDLLGPKPSYQVNASDLMRFCVCPPILQEVLQGIGDDRIFTSLKDRFLALPCVPSFVETTTFLHGMEIYRSGRKRGKTIRSSIDCLIAAIAIENSLPLWHQDRDFNVIAEFTDLKVVAVGKSH